MSPLLCVYILVGCLKKSGMKTMRRKREREKRGTLAIYFWNHHHIIIFNSTNKQNSEEMLLSPNEDDKWKVTGEEKRQLYKIIRIHAHIHTQRLEPCSTYVWIPKPRQSDQFYFPHRANDHLQSIHISMSNVHCRNVHTRNNLVLPLSVCVCAYMKCLQTYYLIYIKPIQ